MAAPRPSRPRPSAAYHGEVAVEPEYRIVSEHRPELFIPAADGTVIPSMPSTTTSTAGTWVDVTDYRRDPDCGDDDGLGGVLARLR